MPSFTPILVGLVGFFSLAVSAPHKRSALARYAVSGQSVALTHYNNGVRPMAPSKGTLRARSGTSASATNGSVSLIDLDNSYAASVTIGTQSYNLVIDTGSSDTWIADSFYNCLGSSRSVFSGALNQDHCGLTPTYVRSNCDPYVSFLDDQHFHVTYGDGSSASGPLADATITIADGMSFISTLGIASNVAWYGLNDNTSGLLGLGYSALTSSFSGTDARQDVFCPHNSSTLGYDFYGDEAECNEYHYTSLIESLNSAQTYENGTYRPLLTKDEQFFSLALSRDTTNTSAGGVLTFGGLGNMLSPGVNITADPAIAVVPIESLTNDDTGTLRFYTISVKGIVLPTFTNTSVPAYTTTTTSYSSVDTDAAMARSNPHRRATGTTLVPLDSTTGTSQFIVDSGTTLSYFPASISASFNSLFVPPAYQSYEAPYYSSSLWQLNCSLSYIPPLGIQIGDETFYHNPLDLVRRSTRRIYDDETGTYAEQEYCYSAIQDVYEPEDGDGTTVGVLGQTFLKNVLAIFDVAQTLMAFVERPYYES